MEFFITFIVLFLIIGTFHSKAENIWLRALIIAAVFAGSSYLVAQYEMIGWIIALIIQLVVVAKVLGYSLGGAFFFLVIFNIIQIFIGLGIEKYLK